jgi:hypothetical protein
MTFWLALFAGASCFTMFGFFLHAALTMSRDEGVARFDYLPTPTRDEWDWPKPVDPERAVVLDYRGPFDAAGAKPVDPELQFAEALDAAHGSKP